MKPRTWHDAWGRGESGEREREIRKRERKEKGDRRCKEDLDID